MKEVVAVAIKRFIVVLLLLGGCVPNPDTSFLLGTINETKIITVYSPITQLSHLALCAYFTIEEKVNDKWQPIKENADSYACGMDWDSILKDIRAQIRNREKMIQEGRDSTNAEIRLKTIKEDFVGKSVR